MAGLVRFIDQREDHPAVLTLTIETTQPIELADFVATFTSLAEQFDEYAKALAEDFIDAKIYVAEIRQGSIVADLLPVLASTVPLIGSYASHALAIENFVTRWGGRLTELASGIVPENASRKDLRVWSDAVEAIARDPHASLHS